jgi:2-aminoadipate transaminase
MLEALQEHFGGRATWTRPQGGLFIWVTLPEYIDTTGLLAQCDGVAFVPGRSAYMDGRRGASSMRLNFAGLPEDEIREGIRRIGKSMGGDTGLLSTLMGSSATLPARADAAKGITDKDASSPMVADVLELPLSEKSGKSRRRHQR